jgi:VWFA-related protein
MKLCVALTLASLSTALAQNPAQTLGQNPARPTVGQDAPLTSHATLVLVPALVRDKGNKLVFSLSANDFVLTDDGVPQKLHLEQDTGGEPLALVVDIEVGGDGARPLAKYESLTRMIDSIVGGVPHEVAVVGYDSSPVLVQDFTPDSDTAAKATHALIHDNNGDDGGATLDSLAFSVDLLRKQPIQYRRAILLIAESRDRGSHVRLDEALRAISDTNTVIYSIGFSSAKSDIGHEGPKTFGQNTGGIPIPGLSSTGPQPPGPAQGCMSRDPNDPQVNVNEKPIEQLRDCLSLLAPPLRLAKIAAIAATDGLEKNIPETTARLTGGEYFKLSNTKSFEGDLATISNHIPNRYVLSFQPQSPHPGFHALALRVPGYVGFEIFARGGYWAETEDSPTHFPPGQTK